MADRVIEIVSYWGDEIVKVQHVTDFGVAPTGGAVWSAHGPLQTKISVVDAAPRVGRARWFDRRLAAYTLASVLVLATVTVVLLAISPEVPEMADEVAVDERVFLVRVEPGPPRWVEPVYFVGGDFSEGLDRAEWFAKRRIEARAADLQRCAEGASVDRREQPGRIALSVEIDPGGTRAVEISGVSPTVADCVAGVIASIDLAGTPVGDGVATVVIPLRF